MLYKPAIDEDLRFKQKIEKKSMNVKKKFEI